MDSWWTIIPRHGIQKVRGSNPLGSTKFLNSESRLSTVVQAPGQQPDNTFDTTIGPNLVGADPFTPRKADAFPRPAGSDESTKFLLAVAQYAWH